MFTSKGCFSEKPLPSQLEMNILFLLSLSTFALTHSHFNLSTFLSPVERRGRGGYLLLYVATVLAGKAEQFI